MQEAEKESLKELFFMSQKLRESARKLNFAVQKLIEIKKGEMKNE